jgi:hypothetical protein
MSSSTSHVGVAIFHHPGFPTRWVLVISADDLFQGRVFCSSLMLSVNGPKQMWLERNSSPLYFTHTGVFAGVIHIAALPVPMESVLSELHLVDLTTTSADPAQTDQYVLQCLSHIGYKYLGPFNLCMVKETLREAIRARIPLLNYCPSTGFYHVASLSLDGVRVGKTTP